MFHLNLNDALSVEEDQVTRDVQLAGSELTVSMSVADQYRANSKTELAKNWLKSWYIAETLAKHANECHCEFKEGANGCGDFQFRFVVEDATGMAKALTEFAQVFDPDNLEAGAFIYDEAHDWLEERGSTGSRFPEIESNYREDAAMAEEYEGYRETNEDDAEDD